MLPSGLVDVNEESQPESGERMGAAGNPSSNTGEALLLPYLKSLVHAVSAATRHRGGRFLTWKFNDQGFSREHQRSDRCSVLER